MWQRLFCFFPDSLFLENDFTHAIEKTTNTANQKMFAAQPFYTDCFWALHR